jgi:hypothetical protein
MDQPGFQLSWFVGGRNGPQIVLRGATAADAVARAAELTEADEGGESALSILLNTAATAMAAAKLILPQQEPPAPPPPARPAGGQQDYRQGGAPWQQGGQGQQQPPRRQWNGGGGGGNGGGDVAPPMQCPSCGAAMDGKTVTLKNGPNAGQRKTVYECTARCGQRNIWKPAGGAGGGNGGQRPPQQNPWGDEPPF